jgi:hypothetical protein
VEHVQWLGMTKGRAFDALHKTLSLVASGAVPPQGAALLGACSLVALPKGPNAVRPIAAGEVLRRIVVRALCIQFRKPMAALFGAGRRHTACYGASWRLRDDCARGQHPPSEVPMPCACVR